MAAAVQAQGYEVGAFTWLLVLRSFCSAHAVPNRLTSRGRKGFIARLISPPAEGYFLELKSRTWSQRDARDKAAIITELLAILGASPDETISDGYVELAARTVRSAESP